MKQLRQVSGAGMMDAKKALLQTGGDVDKALEHLRKKGLASADKKAGRLASEGAIGAYIHAGSRYILLRKDIVSGPFTCMSQTGLCMRDVHHAVCSLLLICMHEPDWICMCTLHQAI